MKLSPQEERQLAELPVTDVHAFECYQRARLEIYKFTQDGLDRALALIKTAFIDETDESLDWLENAVRKDLIHYPFLSERNKILYRLHGHPRFEKLMQEVKYAWEHLEA